MTKKNGKATELAIIGAGPAGYAAAFRAADLGLDVTMIDEAPRPGGVCLREGCIPSKALLHAAKVIGDARDGAAWGLELDGLRVDRAKLAEWKDGVVGRLEKGLVGLSDRRKVRRLQARARFEDSSTLSLEGGGHDVPANLSFERAIVATGSRPWVPATLRIGDERVMDSTGALALKDVPKRLLIVGGGYIGLELGQVYAALGSLVTLVEMTETLLPGVDNDLLEPLRERLDGQFHGLYLSTEVMELEARNEGILARMDGPGVAPQQLFDRVLVAIGRRPRLDELALEKTSVSLADDGTIETDDRMRTADERILAVGDVTGQPMLAHRGTRQGKVAAEALAGEPAAYDSVAVPCVVFTDPEIAWCGLTEDDARRAGREVSIGRFPWTASGRALTLGRPSGVTKLVFEAGSERLLGMGVSGPGAGELIGEGVLAVETGAQARDIGESIHPHPTLSETVAEAAESIFGAAIHVAPPRRAR